MKKRGVSLLLSLALLFLLGACGRQSTSVDSADTLTLMGRKSDLEKSYMTNIFSHYEKESGHKLRLIAIEDAEFEEEAARRFASGDAPDIFLHFHNADLSRFDVDNNFYFLNDQSWVGELTDSARNYCLDSEGRLLGLPYWENSVSGCYYNRALLDRLGLRPATTQDEFDILCQTLAASGFTPICWPANGCTWMFQFGLDPIFADNPELLEQLNRNEITYSDIPAVSDMVDWIAGAAESGWFGDDYLKTGWDDISSRLGSGEAVMTFIWDTWFYTDFSPDGEYGLDSFALMPVFMNTAYEGTYEGGNLNMMMVNRNSARLEQALDFLSFCATPENYNVAFNNISTVSCFTGQTTNIQSQMVTEAADSIASRERVSTAASKIIGYSADDVSAAFAALFQGKSDVAACVRDMDERRMERARAQGAEGF